MYFPLIDFSLMWTSLPFVLQGLIYTLGIGFVSFLLGNLVGLLLTVLGLLDWLPLNVFIRFYLSFFRGIPALVLLFLIFRVTLSIKCLNGFSHLLYDYQQCIYW